MKSITNLANQNITYNIDPDKFDFALIWQFIDGIDHSADLKQFSRFVDLKFLLFKIYFATEDNVSRQIIEVENIGYTRCKAERFAGNETLDNKA